MEETPMLMEFQCGKYELGVAFWSDQRVQAVWILLVLAKKKDTGGLVQETSLSLCHYILRLLYWFGAIANERSGPL
ncbi:conserved hypothetical protein [Ricinus communis]|uniref:Uncharacterized protein n=1 Tax=Ricinus communis TaxID=3988 RepID=B9SUS7_RICCO|nr:conserved hypothetical protein [Ricinus communis]